MTRARSERCAGLVLTGGASRRLGSAKAAWRVGDETLAARVARVLRELAEPVLEVGPGWTTLDAVVEEEAGAGPLAAVAAGGAALAARGAGDRPVLVVAVDLPHVDAGALGLLAEHAAGGGDAGGGVDAVVPRVDGRAQPLCAAYSPAALARARVLVADGARAMYDLLAVLSVRWLDESAWSAVTTARAFLDVDTPDAARRAGLEPPG